MVGVGVSADYGRGAAQRVRPRSRPDERSRAQTLRAHPVPECLACRRGDRLILAVLTGLSDQHEGLSGRWFLEAGFGIPNGPDHPIFPDLDAAQDWITRRFVEQRARMPAASD